MATFTFNKTKLEKFKAELKRLGKSDVWFQPTHHGGCLQIIGWQTKEHAEVFRSSNTGYNTICATTILVQDATLLNAKWVDMLLKAKLAKFKANYNRTKKQMEYKLTTTTVGN